MAGRPHKKGLDYLPLDIDFWDKEKVEDLYDDHGAEGIIRLLKLWSYLYSKGYYFDVIKSKRHFCRLRNVDQQSFDTLIKYLVEKDFFSKDKYQKYHILTSDSIQERLLFGSKRRTVIKFTEEHLEISLVDYPQFKEKVEVRNLKNELIEDVFKPKRIPKAKVAPKPRVEKKASSTASAIPDPVKLGYTYQEVLDFIKVPYNERTDEFKQLISQQTYRSYIVINGIIDKDYKNLRESRFQMSIYDWQKLFKETKFTQEELLSVLTEVSGAGVNETMYITSRLKTYIGYARKKAQKPPAATEAPKPTQKVLYDYRDQENK